MDVTVFTEVLADLRARQADTTSVEVKSAAGGCPDLAATLSAFGNMPDGGTIILGLDESAGFSPVGLTDVASLEQSVASQARTAVVPPVQCTFTTLDISGRKVLVCSVAGLPLMDRPCRHGGQAYLRQSDGDYPMSEQEIAQLELLKTQGQRRTNPDLAPVPGTSTADLDQGLMGAFIASARQSTRRHSNVDDDEVLRRMGVLAGNGELTLAGLYALGSYPQQFARTLSITAAVQLPRGTGARTRDLMHFDGPLSAMLSDAMDWVQRNTRATQVYRDSGHLSDRSELPMQAVREIVANALVHRNLDPVTDSKRIEIRLKDDALVITSPGGLWGVSEQQLGQSDGKSAVNGALYDICKLARLSDGSRVIEGEGGGIREAMLALREAGLHPPHFIDAGVRFTAIISRHSMLTDDDLDWLSGLEGADSLSSEQRAILAQMRAGVEYTNAMVREQFPPLDSVVARGWLRQLVDLGFAEAVGERGATAYRLAAAAEDWTASNVAVVRSSVDPAVKALSGGEVLVWDALDRERTLKEIVRHTELNPRRARYALDKLSQRGLVETMAESGKASRYRRSEA